MVNCVAWPLAVSVEASAFIHNIAGYDKVTVGSFFDDPAVLVVG